MRRFLAGIAVLSALVPVIASASIRSTTLAPLTTITGGRFYSSSSSSSGGGGGGFACEFYIDDAGSDSNNGLTQGTPWAITGINTKRATYASAVVCLMDGNYDLSGMNAYNGVTGFASAPILNVAEGTPGDPTVITAVNCRAPVLRLTSGGGTRKALPAIGQGPGGGHYGNVTIDCLTITGGQHWLTAFSGESKDTREQWATGIIVQNSHFSDNVYQGGDNNPAIYLNDVLNPIVRNNWFEDILDTVNGEGPSTMMTLSVRGLVYEYNTAINTRSFILDKHNDAPSYANDAFVIRCNRGEDLIHPAIIGLDTEYEAQSPDDDYQASEVYGNLLINSRAVWQMKVSSPTRMDVTVHHNTVSNSSGSPNGLVLAASQTTSDLVGFHSNILDTIGLTPVEYGFFGASAGGLGTLNWNAYPTGAFNANLATPINSFDGSTTWTGYSSLSAWRTATGQETNSIQADCALDANYAPTNAACIGTAQSGTNMGHTGSSCTRAGANFTP